MTLVMNPDIARLTPASVDPVLAIEQSDGDAHWTRDHFEHEIASEIARFFVLREGGNILGYGGYWKVGYEAQITNLVIARSQRRKGLGQRLLNHLLKEAKAEGCTVVTLEVRSKNTPAQKLYEHTGFSIQGKRSRAYTHPADDAVHMEKTL